MNKDVVVIYNPENEKPFSRKVLSVTTKERAKEVLGYFTGMYPKAEIRPITDVVTDGEHLEAQVEELFTAFGDFYEVYQNGKYLCVDIEHGDWKHDHLHCNHVMETVFNLSCEKEEIWEPSEDDSYSATHYFVEARKEQA